MGGTHAAVRSGTACANGPRMRDNDVWIQLENMQERMCHVLEQLQQVHAKLASTAITADRVFIQMSAEHAILDLGTSR
jgi:hypothetical protein